MINKDELLNNRDFYKSFKTGEDLTTFFKELHKKAVEHMLEAELDAHPDNKKHEKSKEGNYRNGHGTKKIKSSFGESAINVPWDREGSFEPVLVPKKAQYYWWAGEYSFYAKGMSVSDIEEQIREIADSA